LKGPAQGDEFSCELTRPAIFDDSPGLTVCRQTLLSDIMKTLPLRDLLRQPAKVKRLTAAGHPVRVTDRGKPLWVIQPDNGSGNYATVQIDDDDAFWQELLETPKSGLPSACRLLIESRG
jgi:hypothetical protein